MRPSPQRLLLLCLVVSLLGFTLCHAKLSGGDEAKLAAPTATHSTSATDTTSAVQQLGASKKGLDTVTKLKTLRNAAALKQHILGSLSNDASYTYTHLQSSVQPRTSEDTDDKKGSFDYGVTGSSHGLGAADSATDSGSPDGYGQDGLRSDDRPQSEVYDGYGQQYGSSYTEEDNGHSSQKDGEADSSMRDAYAGARAPGDDSYEAQHEADKAPGGDSSSAYDGQQQDQHDGQLADGNHEADHAGSGEEYTTHETHSDSPSAEAEHDMPYGEDASGDHEPEHKTPKNEEQSTDGDSLQAGHKWGEDSYSSPDAYNHEVEHEAPTVNTIHGDAPSDHESEPDGAKGSYSPEFEHDGPKDKYSSTDNDSHHQQAQGDNAADQHADQADESEHDNPKVDHINKGADSREPESQHDGNEQGHDKPEDTHSPEGEHETPYDLHSTDGGNTDRGDAQDREHDSYHPPSALPGVEQDDTHTDNGNAGEDNHSGYGSPGVHGGDSDEPEHNYDESDSDKAQAPQHNYDDTSAGQDYQEYTGKGAEYEHEADTDAYSGRGSEGSHGSGSPVPEYSQSPEEGDDAAYDGQHKHERHSTCLQVIKAHGDRLGTSMYDLRCCTEEDSQKTCSNEARAHASALVGHDSWRFNPNTYGGYASGQGVDKVGSCTFARTSDPCPPSTKGMCHTYTGSCTLSEKAASCGCPAKEGLRFQLQAYAHNMAALSCTNKFELDFSTSARPSPRGTYGGDDVYLGIGTVMKGKGGISGPSITFVTQFGAPSSTQPVKASRRLMSTSAEAISSTTLLPPGLSGTAGDAVRMQQQRKQGQKEQHTTSQQKEQQQLPPTPMAAQLLKAARVATPLPAKPSPMATPLQQNTTLVAAKPAPVAAPRGQNATPVVAPRPSQPAPVVAPQQPVQPVVSDQAVTAPPPAKPTPVAARQQQNATPVAAPSPAVKPKPVPAPVAAPQQRSATPVAASQPAPVAAPPRQPAPVATPQPAPVAAPQSAQPAPAAEPQQPQPASAQQPTTAPVAAPQQPSPSSSSEPSPGLQPRRRKQQSQHQAKHPAVRNLPGAGSSKALQNGFGFGGFHSGHSAAKPSPRASGAPVGGHLVLIPGSHATAGPAPLNSGNTALPTNFGPAPRAPLPLPDLPFLEGGRMIITWEE